MRCVDAIRELADPTENLDAAGPLADHLAQCPQCAALAQGDPRLGLLWEATRPVEPSPLDWEPVWARIADRLDRADDAPAVVPFSPARPGRRALAALLGLAQAAAILLIVFYSTRPPEPRRARPEAISTAGLVGEIDVEAGQFAVIREDGDGIHVTDLALNEKGTGVDPGFDLLNSMEAIADQ